ncbi:MAG: thioredoxin-disulfide reductase activity, partial [Paramarteilia canceri]
SKKCSRNTEPLDLQYQYFLSNQVATKIRENKFPKSSNEDAKCVPLFTTNTPYEYSSMGLNNKQAIERYGEEDVEVFTYSGSILEHSLSFGQLPNSFIKVISIKSLDKLIVGIQVLSPYASKVLS